MRATLATLALLVAAATAQAEVIKVSIASRSSVANGQSFGTTGPYEKLTGTIEFALDPTDRRNQAIVDLTRVARDSDGRVHFTADLFVLQPVDHARGNDVMLFEISNRGGKGLLTRFNRARGSADPTSPEDFGDGLLMRQGYTLVWVGWEFDVAQGLKLQAPRVTFGPSEKVEAMRLRFVLDATAPEATLNAQAPMYAPADLNDSSATLTVRDRFWDTPAPIARERWRFVANARAPQLALDGGFQAGRLYEVTFQPAHSYVAGVGMAAIRDAASAFRYRTDLPVHGSYAYVYGSSQSGRFLRQFLHDGFNTDEKNRQAFHAVWAHIAGAARGSFNERYATPTNLSPYVATAPPFSSLGDDTVKIVYTNTSVEYWGLARSAALIHTNPTGTSELTLRPNERVYLLAGTQHGEAAFPPQRGNGQLLPNPTPQAAVMRALLRGIDQWVRTNVPPPASRYPRLSDGTLVPVAKLNFPSLPGVGNPRTITGPRSPLPFLVPQVDADGNEIGGIRVPEQTVPLATTTGWNFRSEKIGNSGDIVNLTGSYIAFPRQAVEREASKDPRLSIQERYGSRDVYLDWIKVAAAALVQGGYLLAEDVEIVVARAARHWDHLMAQTVTVAVESTLGTIELAIDTARAPITAANFLRYVDAKMYDGGRFHRAVRMDNQVRDDVKIEVVQAGRAPEAAKLQPGFGPIVLERTSLTQLKHVDGALSMARGNTADSASSDFFICIGDQPSLDFGGARAADGQGFAVFGRVVGGMDVVRRIQALSAPKERLDPPVTITRVYRK